MVRPVDDYTRPAPPRSYMMRAGSDQRFPIDPGVSRAEMERRVNRKARKDNAQDALYIVAAFLVVMALFVLVL